MYWPGTCLSGCVVGSRFTTRYLPLTISHSRRPRNHITPHIGTERPMTGNRYHMMCVAVYEYGEASDGCARAANSRKLHVRK